MTLHFVAMQQKAAVEQSDTIASDMEVYMKRRCVIEFLHMVKMAPIDIGQYLLNVDGNQTVDVSSVRVELWVTFS